MEFWLSFNNFTEKLQLPVNPGEFRIRTGNKNTVVDIQALGEINLIGGERLVEVELSSFFPAAWAPYCSYQDISKPYDAVALIEKWRKSGRPIRLIITDTLINYPMAIEEFEYGERGGTRDVNYSLTLREYRFVQVKQVGQTSQAAAPSARPDEKPKPNVYIVKSGDTLWMIAKNIVGDGSKWKQIYDVNKNIIGPDAGIIKPGQQLVIPA